jgi:hypothetical protein
MGLGSIIFKEWRVTWTFSYTYRVLYIAFLNKLLIFFVTKLTIKSHIIEYGSVVTVAEWLDGSFESQSGLEKPNSGSIPESPKICLTRF